MSKETRRTSGSERMGDNGSSRGQHEYVVYDVGAGKAPAAGRPTVVRAARDTSTDVVNSFGLVTLAALETLDVVGRTAGRMAYNATLDFTRAGSQLSHEVSRSMHDTLVDLAQTAVDTGVDVGAQVSRGADLLVQQGRGLVTVAEDVASSVISMAMGLYSSFRSSKKKAEPANKPTVTAVPIVVN